MYIERNILRPSTEHKKSESFYWLINRTAWPTTAQARLPCCFAQPDAEGHDTTAVLLLKRPIVVPMSLCWDQASHCLQCSQSVMQAFQTALPGIQREFLFQRVFSFSNCLCLRCELWDSRCVGGDLKTCSE